MFVCSLSCSRASREIACLQLLEECRRHRHHLLLSSGFILIVSTSPLPPAWSSTSKEKYRSHSCFDLQDVGLVQRSPITACTYLSPLRSPSRKTPCALAAEEARTAALHPAFPYRSQASVAVASALSNVFTHNCEPSLF
jgi:hypothetical protein